MIHYRMDYQYLRQRLMMEFQQLVIFDLKLITFNDYLSLKDNALVYNLSNCVQLEHCRYYQGNYEWKQVVIILNPSNTGDTYNDQLTDIYNMYNAIVCDAKHYTSFETMNQLTLKLNSNDLQIHWIWFREKGYYLADKIMTRAKSWIVLNPDFKCYLWTNLSDSVELNDFISKLHPSNQELFKNGQIIVKYNHEVGDMIERFGSLYLNPSMCDELRQIYQTGHAYKIMRIFRVDLLRLIVLCLNGGIYCDFNDTICFYPMKYLLTLYVDKYFVGTDYDVHHPIFRNNYFIYTSFNNPTFLQLSLKCVNSAIIEHRRITSSDFILQYNKIAINILKMTSVMNKSDKLVSLFTQSTLVKTLLDVDKHKDMHRVILLITDIYDYLGSSNPQIKRVSQQLSSELSTLDVRSLNNSIIRVKRNRRVRCELHQPLGDNLPIDEEFLLNLLTTKEYYDYFLMKYAIHNTIGDLILSTNVAYIDDIPYLVPYLRSNRLSTISMLTHLYDGTSYGLDRQYEQSSVDINLRRDLL